MDKLADIALVLRDADPDDKAEIFRQLPHGMTPAELAGGFGLPGAGSLTGRIEDSMRAGCGVGASLSNRRRRRMVLFGLACRLRESSGGPCSGVSFDVLHDDDDLATWALGDRVPDGQAVRGS